MPFKPVDAAIKVIVGPAIDDGDFKSREESLSFNQAGMEVDVILEKYDGTIVTTAVTPTAAGDYDWAHTDQGYYELELPASGGATFNNTEEGIITVAVFCTGVLPFRSVSYDVVPALVYASMVKGTDNLQVDAIQISGDATAANNAELAFDGTGFGFTNCTMPTVSTLTGHTAQTGDSFARIGATGSGLTTLAQASVCLEARLAELAAANIPADIDTLITRIPNTISLANIRTQADDALIAINLDHLIKIAVDTNWTTTVHLDSVLGHIADVGTIATFDRTIDSLEALRTRGDAAWITATGFSTHSAVNVWAVATRQLTGTQTFNLTGNITGDLSGSVGSLTGHVGQTGDSYAIVNHGTYGLVAIETLVDEIETLLKDGTYGLSAIETLIDEVETLLKDATYGLSALRTRGDAAWITAVGFAVSNEYDVVIANIPTVAEFNARTLLAANYFDYTTDDVTLTAATIDAILDEVIGDAIHATPDSVGAMLHAVYCRFMQKRTATTTVEKAYKLDDVTELKSFTLSDDTVTVTRL